MIGAGCAPIVGIAMPPSDQLEEIGALATLIDENRFNYGLDALCEWRGLPGKDTTLLEEAVKAAGFKISKKNPLQSYIWQLPARYVGPYAEADAVATLALFEKLNPILDQEGTRDAYRLDVDLLPMVHRDAPARHSHRSERRRTGARLLPAETRSRARRAVGAARHAASAWHEIAVAKWKARTFDAHRHQLSAHGEGQSVVQGRQTRVDGDASALAAAADRDRQQVRRTPAAHFSKVTSSST